MKLNKDYVSVSAIKGIRSVSISDSGSYIYLLTDNSFIPQHRGVIEENFTTYKYGKTQICIHHEAMV
jgi:uncharacterized protein (UPF0248 family)